MEELKSLITRYAAATEELQRIKQERIEPFRQEVLLFLRSFLNEKIFSKFPHVVKVRFSCCVNVYNDEQDVYHDIYSMYVYLAQDEYNRRHRGSKYFSENDWEHGVHEDELDDEEQNAVYEVRRTLEGMVKLLETLSADGCEVVVERDTITTEEFRH